MAEKKAPTEVKVIRGDLREAPAIVDDPEQLPLPWPIHEKETGLPVSWQVIIALPDDREAQPLVFATRAHAKAWSDRDPRAQGLDWYVLHESDPPARKRREGEPEDLTARLREFAEEKGLPVDSPELFELAVQAGILNTLVFYEQYGCTGEPYVVNWASTRFPWIPRSCRSRGRSDLFGSPDPVSGVVQLLPLRGDIELDALPFPVQSAYTDD